MAFDLNEDIKDSNSFDRVDLLFREGLDVRFPNNKSESVIYVMPAHAAKGTVPDDQLPISWVPYRAADGSFSCWALGFRSWTLIGRKLNLLDPSTIDERLPNPAKAIFDVASTTPEFYHLVGKGPDGKKIPNGDIPFMGAPAVQYAINGVELSPKREEDREKSCVWIVKATAMKPRKSYGKGKENTTSDWGLLSALDLRNRGVDQISPSDFSRYYYWGDITHPGALVPCRIACAPAPGGGLPIYNMRPMESTRPGNATLGMMQSRVSLPSIFRNNEVKEVIAQLVDIFSDYPTLIRRALEQKFPGVDNLLRQAQVISDSVVHGAGFPTSDFATPALPQFASPAQQQTQSAFATPAPVQQAAAPAPTQAWTPAPAVAPVTHPDPHSPAVAGVDWGAPAAAVAAPVAMETVPATQAWTPSPTPAPVAQAPAQNWTPAPAAPIAQAPAFTPPVMQAATVVSAENVAKTAEDIKRDLLGGM